MELKFNHMPVEDFCALMNGVAGDPRYERAARELPALVAHFSITDPDAPESALRLRAQRAAEIRDWIEDGKPLVKA